jgi:hypothetical protein
MTDPNGWPDPSKPGVPMNPERDGWHWVDRPMHGVLPMQWLEIAGGGWVGKHTCLTALEATKAGWLYVGPCHTPAEVAALIEVARRESERAALAASARSMRVAALIEAARREEREACARVAEILATGLERDTGDYEAGYANGALDVCRLIRARGDA